MDIEIGSIKKKKGAAYASNLIDNSNGFSCTTSTKVYKDEDEREESFPDDNDGNSKSWKKVATVENETHKHPFNPINMVVNKDVNLTGFNNSWINKKIKTDGINRGKNYKNCLNEKRYSLVTRNKVKAGDTTKSGVWGNSELEHGKRNKKSKCQKLFKCTVCEIELTLQVLIDKCTEKCKPNSTDFQYKCCLCEKTISNKYQVEKHLIVHMNEEFICSSCNTIVPETNTRQGKISKNIRKCSKKFTCNICNKSFSHLVRLKTHKSTHSESESSECQNCFKTFKSTKKHVCSKRQSVCFICNSTFLKPTMLKSHLHQHHGIPLKCSVCEKSFECQMGLENHKKSENCLSDHETCEMCGKVLNDVSTYEEHVETHGRNRKKCDDCVKVFSDTEKFSQHVTGETCEKDSPKKYDCNDCGQKYPNLVTLKIHVLNVHEGINFECKKCLRKFTSQEEQEAHEGKENCSQEDPCKCDLCGKVFAKRDYLKKHQHMHTNVLFKCKYCYCAFIKENSYNRHIEKMNCSKSARKIRLMEFNFRKCRICQVEYETEDSLLAHFGDSHKDEQPHQCFCCESRLPTYRDLQTHIHHHNVKKYTCHLCGKPYTSQEGFRKHRLKHKGAQFKCKFCESEFLNENRFKFHEKTCKKNPETGYDPTAENPKKKDQKPKQSRQLHWESRIIMKHLRGDPKLGQADTSAWTEGIGEKSISLSFFDEPETTELTNERGWFDNYYKTEEDDIAFGLRKADAKVQDDQPDNGKNDLQQRQQTTAEAKKTRSANVEGLNESRNVESLDGSLDTNSDASELSSSEEDESLDDVELPIDYNPKKCRLCHVTFTQEYELLHHFIKAHPNEMAHKCPNCEAQSPLFAQLKEHLKVHGIGMDVYNCDNCSKKFKSEKKMKSHNLRCKGLANTDEKPSGERCKRCGKKFNTKFGYRRHNQLCKIKNKRDRKKKGGACDVASKEDAKSTMDDKKAEVQSVEPTREEPKKQEVKQVHMVEPPLDSYPCRLCEKKFQYERGIVMHFKSDHPGHKPLICHVCNMHLADKLKEHLKTHGIGEEFICELCGKRFNQKFLSKIHEMWHQGVEYKCGNCKQKFLNKEKMDKHVGENRCGNRQSLMHLPCVICGKSYRSKFGLSKHYITHTPKELRPVKNKMNCEYCGKWFENNNGLQRHRRIHTGEKPYCCRFCPKAFAQEGNCKAHERIHTGESRPRKKKAQNQTAIQSSTILAVEEEILPASIQPQVPQTTATTAAATAVDPLPYSTHINVYTYNPVDSGGPVNS